MEKLSGYVMTAEAAKILGVSQTTLRKYAEAGKIRMRRNPVNGYRLFKREELEAFLRQLDEPETGSTQKSEKKSK
jgi:excisionase family DNA binding protein